MRVLIIDDEKAARETLGEKIQLVTNEASITKAESPFMALKLLKDEFYDIVFLDIQMPGLTGFEMLAHIPMEERNFSLVFCTAYSEYSLKAFDEQAIDYLVKPVELERLKSTFLRLENTNKDKWNKYIEDQNEVLARFSVKIGDQIKIISAEDILYFTSDYHETLVYTDGDKEYIVDMSLDHLERELDPKVFFRTHRGFIVAKAKIASVDQKKMKVYFKESKKAASISKRKKAAFLKFI